MNDIEPIKSRYDSRMFSQTKKQILYGRRHYKTHMDWLETQLDCLELNRQLHPEQNHQPRHRVLTSKPDKWYKTQKKPCHDPWRRGQRIRHSKRKVRNAMKTKMRLMDSDYIVKTSWDNANGRHR